MLCEKCGVQNDNTNHCTNCGHPLMTEQPAAPNVNYSQPANQYAYPPPPAYAPPKENEHVSVGFWIGISCINLIPCVGGLIYLIMMFVWAFGSTPKKSLKNYARAQLIIAAVALGLSIIFIIVTTILGMSVFNNIGNIMDNIGSIY